MNDSGKEASGWSRGRWALIIAVFFVGQVFLLFVERRPKTAVLPRSNPRYHLFSHPITSSQIAHTFFASDPTLFSAASLHSFSGPAWLRISGVNYGFPDHDKPTNWLSLDTDQLGRLPELSFAAKSGQVQPEEFARPPVTYSFLDTELVQTQSLVRIEGDLALREVEVPAALPAWSRKDVLKKSVVQLAVDRAGVVLSTRLLQDGRSGFQEADYEALEIARMLQFDPAPNASVITRGKLVIEWCTVLPVENEAPARK